MSLRAGERSQNYHLKRMLVMKVECPECLAEPGARCTGKKGQKRTTCHKKRWDAAGVSTFIKDPLAMLMSHQGERK